MRLRVIACVHELKPMQGRRPRLVLSRMLFRESFRDGTVHRAALERKDKQARKKSETTLHALDGLASSARARNFKQRTAFAPLHRATGYTVAITAVAAEGGNGCCRA